MVRLANSTDNIKRTPLHIAAAFGEVNVYANTEPINIFWELIRRGADVNALTIVSLH